MNPALSAPEIGSVTNQAITILRNNFQSTDSRDLTRPTATTDPTLQCVVDIGIPMLEAISTVRADPISIQNPLKNKLFCYKSASRFGSDNLYHTYQL